jgi:hypothetical protein
MTWIVAKALVLAATVGAAVAAGIAKAAVLASTMLAAISLALARAFSAILRWVA